MSIFTESEFTISPTNNMMSRESDFILPISSLLFYPR